MCRGEKSFAPKNLSPRKIFRPGVVLNCFVLLWGNFLRAGMNYLHPLLQYILRRPYGIHSPFLYDFAEQCMYASGDQDAFDHPERFRSDLENNHTTIIRKDFGAGNRQNQLRNLFGDTSGKVPPALFHEKAEKVSTVAQRSLQRAKYCRLFYRMARYLNAKNILELGTSFGISTAYFAMGNPSACIHTIEACPQTAAVAQRLFNQAGLSNIRQYTASFREALPSILNETKQFDIVYIDGDHSYRGVTEYFSLVSKHMAPDGVIIIDDIRWSQQMWKAWKHIINSHDVSLSVDLGYIGMAFFLQNLSKENIMMGY